MAQTLWTSDNPVYPGDWSRDGQYLAYTESRPNTSNDVWQIRMSGEPNRTPLVQSPFTELHPQFSPDRQWLAFTSNESGREDVYVQHLANANSRRLVSSGGGSYPRWGAEGGELWYRALDGRLMLVPVRIAGLSVELGSPRATIRLADAPGVHPYPYDIAPDGRILALMPAAGSAQQLTVLMNWQAALEP